MKLTIYIFTHRKKRKKKTKIDITASLKRQLSAVGWSWDPRQQHSHPDVPSKGLETVVGGGPEVRPTHQLVSSSSSSGLPWSLFLAFNPSCPSSSSGRWLDTGGGAGSRGRYRAGRKEEGVLKGKLGWVARSQTGARSFDLLSQNLPGGWG